MVHRSTCVCWLDCRGQAGAVTPRQLWQYRVSPPFLCSRLQSTSGGYQRVRWIQIDLLFHKQLNESGSNPGYSSRSAFPRIFFFSFSTHMRINATWIGCIACGVPSSVLKDSEEHCRRVSGLPHCLDRFAPRCQ